MRSRFRLHGVVADRRGSVVMEFAIVIPVMFMLMVGLWEGTTYVRTAMRVTQSAGAVATLLAEQAGTITTTELQDICTAGKDVMIPFPTGGSSGANGAYALSIASYTTVGNPGALTTAQDWEEDGTCTIASGPSLGPYPGPLPTIFTNTAADGKSDGPLSNDCDSVIVVQVSYTYSPLYAGLPQSVQPVGSSSIATNWFTGPITFTSTAYQRPRSNGFMEDANFTPNANELACVS